MALESLNIKMDEKPVCKRLFLTPVIINCDRLMSDQHAMALYYLDKHMDHAYFLVDSIDQKKAPKQYDYGQRVLLHIDFPGYPEFSDELPEQ